MAGITSGKGPQTATHSSSRDPSQLHQTVNAVFFLLEMTPKSLLSRRSLWKTQSSQD